MVRQHILTKYKSAEVASDVRTQMSDDHDAIRFEACFADPRSNPPSDRGLTCSRSFLRTTILPRNSSNCQYGGVAVAGSDGNQDNTAFKFAATVFPDRLIAMRREKLGLNRSYSSRNLTQSCPQYCQPSLVLGAHRSCESSPLKARPESHCHEIPTILHEPCVDLGECAGFVNCPDQQFYQTQNRYFNALDAATSIRTALQRDQQIGPSEGCRQIAAPINEGLQGRMCVSKNRSLERLRVLNPTPNVYNPSNLKNFQFNHRCRQAVPQGLATVLGPRMPLDLELQIQKCAPRGLAAVINVDHCCVENELHQQQEQEQMEMQEQQQQEIKMLEEQQQQIKMLEEKQRLQLLQQQHDLQQQQQQQLQQQQQFQQQQRQFQQQQQLLIQQQQLQKQQQQLEQLTQQQQVEEDEDALRSSVSLDSCSEHNCEKFEPLEPPLRSSSVSVDPCDDLHSLDLRPGCKRKRLSMRSSSFTESTRQPDINNDSSLHRQMERMSVNERSLKSWRPRDSLEGYVCVGNPSVYRDKTVVNERTESNAYGSSKASMVSFNTSAARTSGSARSSSPRCRRGDTNANIRSFVQQAVQQQLRIQKAVQDAVQEEMNGRCAAEGESSSLSESSDEPLPRSSSRFPSRLSLGPQECYAEKVATDARNALEILDKTQAELCCKIRSQSRSKSRRSRNRPPSSSSGSADGWTVSVSSRSPESGRFDASASSSFLGNSSRRKSVEPPRPVGISYEDRMASITQLLNSMNSVTQLLNSMPVRADETPAQAPAYGQMPGQPGSFSQMPGQPGSFSQMPGQPGSFSQMPGQPGSFTMIPGQQDSSSSFPGQMGSFVQMPGPLVPGYSVQVPMGSFDARRASRRGSIGGRRTSRRASMGRRKSEVPVETDDESLQDSETAAESEEEGGQGVEEGESEELEQIDESEQEGEQDENSSEQPEGMAANYQPTIQSQTIDQTLQLSQSQVERLNGSSRNPTPVLHVMRQQHSKALISAQKFTQADRIRKPNVAQKPQEFPSQLVNLQSHTAQCSEVFKLQTDGKKSLLSIVYVMLQELEVLESRSRQKSAAYELRSPTKI